MQCSYWQSDIRHFQQGSYLCNYMAIFGQSMIEQYLCNHSGFGSVNKREQEQQVAYTAYSPQTSFHTARGGSQLRDFETWQSMFKGAGDY